jgi:hypothetical protein
MTMTRDELYRYYETREGRLVRAYRMGEVTGAEAQLHACLAAIAGYPLQHGRGIRPRQGLRARLRALLTAGDGDRMPLIGACL